MKAIKYIKQCCCFLSLVMYLLLSTSASAKSACKDKLKKLHNIQKMQRQSYANKRGESLRKKEDKARKAWWQCEHSSSASLKKKKHKATTTKVTNYQSKASKKHNQKVKGKHQRKTSKATPFQNSKTIGAPIKYEGGKQSAWLVFYHQPNKCRRPKSMSVFASCSENKQQQRQTFEKRYSNLK